MSPVDKGLMLHVGLPKTGTTTIQRALFACHPQVYYLGKIVKNNDTRKKCLDDATYQILKNVLWNLDKPFDSDHIKSLFKDGVLSGIPEDRFLVGSWEDLGNRSTDRFVEMLRRVKSVFGACRIMYTLRNPVAQIPSEYIQNLRGHFVKREKFWLGFNTYVDIEDWYRKRDLHKGKVAPFLNYSDCIRASIEHLGKENVGVFLFEDLQTNPTEYYRSVCEFVGIDPDVGVSLAERKHLHGRISQSQVDYLREVHSSWLRRFSVWCTTQSSRRAAFMAKEGGEPAKAFLSEKLHREVSDASREGHRWLVENCNLPLQKYDYPL